ncbi:DUF3883 domain-containing protein [Garciella nitratireducens]|uniref:Protein NO VEIN C-terminal domain-containing protein n=1 Tax=Garciella nitratireducens DSM 15102 TaxID=1121911 RepID=A0A1T4PG34_9FIRM|nr:DUF3883 domain-containing protein [Garciella nitratireducens]SJZ90277.1 protein of unknown function [Garciella nitratireducens DSM 15102]
MKAMIFLNTAWMERYEGLLGNDKEIHGGGSYVEEYGYGHEIFNFKKISGKVYGYAQPSGYNNLQRLGASEDDEFIDDVLVIFTATHKNGGTYIVGWYKNARFFKHYQNTNLSERKFRNEYIGYYAVANADNATLLSIDERFSFPIIPRRVKGGMGQSNVWYADSPEMVDFKKEVLRHIERYEKKKSIRRRLPIFRQTDAELRKKIENIAIREVTREYSERGFTVTSVESENLGWDLEAVYKKIKLKIEVKGLAGQEVSVELTPNEFLKMNNNKDSYRLCVVTKCLENPELYVFSYSSERNEWISEDGHILSIDQIISARCYT